MLWALAFTISLSLKLSFETLFIVRVKSQSKNFVSGFNEFMEFKITNSSNWRIVHQHFSDRLTYV